MSSKYSRRNRNRITEQFTPMTVGLLESPVWRVLSLSGHRVMARVCVEHSHHGGRENGKLPVSYDDFEAYGIERHCIAAAIREVVALGLLCITREGRAGNAEWRQVAHYRITFLYGNGMPPTHEWRRWQSLDDARKAARAARRAQANKNRSPVRKTRTGLGVEKPTTTRQFLSGDSPTTGPGKTPTTFYISISGGRSGGGGGVVCRRERGQRDGVLGDLRTELASNSHSDVLSDVLDSLGSDVVNDAGMRPRTRLRLATDSVTAAVNRRRLVDPEPATVAATVATAAAVRNRLGEPTRDMTAM
jgi:hypothetical protein